MAKVINLNRLTGWICKRKEREKPEIPKDQFTDKICDVCNGEKTIFIGREQCPCTFCSGTGFLLKSWDCDEDDLQPFDCDEDDFLILCEDDA